MGAKTGAAKHKILRLAFLRPDRVGTHCQSCFIYFFPPVMSAIKRDNTCEMLIWTTTKRMGNPATYSSQKISTEKS